MENILKVTSSEDAGPMIESTHNPGNYALPNFVQKDGAYYIHFPGEKVTSAFAQNNDFCQVLFTQLEYDNNGVVVRFVTINNEVKSSAFTVTVMLEKSDRLLTRPSPLIDVITDAISDLDISKAR